MKDPVIYKILAVAQMFMWGSFAFRYVRVLVANGTLQRPRLRQWKLIVNGRSMLAKFAGAVLMIAVAMVAYSLATVLRQFYGLDYPGRDAVRIVSSVLILAAGITFHRVLGRERHVERPMRRATDLH